MKTSGAVYKGPRDLSRIALPAAEPAASSNWDATVLPSSGGPWGTTGRATLLRSRRVVDPAATGNAARQESRPPDTNEAIRGTHLKFNGVACHPIPVLKTTMPLLLKGLLVLTCLTSEGCGQDAGNDAGPNTTVKKLSHPSFKSRLADADYQARLTAAASQINEATTMAATPRPAVGLTIKHVAEGSPADDLGLNPGDLAGRINGAAIWTTTTFGLEARRSLEFFSTPSQKMKTVRLPAGKIGIATIEYWRPEWDYLRSKSARADWNSDAVLGEMMASIDPDLAETAWSAAFAKGYVPDAYSAAAGLQIALARSDAELAAACADYLGSLDAKQTAHVHPVVLYRAALANGRLSEMQRVLEKHPGIIPVDPGELQRLIELQSHSATTDPKTSLADTAAARYVRVDQLPGSTGHWHNDLRFSLPALQKKEALTLRAEPGRWDAVFVSPPEPTPNVDISFTFTWSPINEAQGEFHSNVEVALVENSSPEYGLGNIGDQRPALMAFSITQSSDATNEFGVQGYETRARLLHYPAQVPFQYVEPWIKWGPDAKYEVRILKLGDRGELFVNGRRQMSIPLDPHLKQIGLRIANSASEMVIHNVRFDELVEDATK